MKSYIIKIEIAGSEPIIWRRVIMPAGATFNRLNDIIQNVTNFQSGYPYGDYHLYEFDLREENLIVTNDEEAFQSHQHYKKNKKMYDERSLIISSQMETGEWHKKLGGGAIADAILDRAISNSYHLYISGDSLRMKTGSAGSD